MAYFKVEVNPFTRYVELRARIKGVDEFATVYYDQELSDEIWYEFTMGETNFEINLCYDKSLEVTIEDEFGNVQGHRCKIVLKHE